MNHYSYEVLAKEKVKGFQAEGLGSQAHYKSGALGFSLFRGLPKLIMVILGILGVLGLLAR
jgi:hypothetical protein